MYVSSANLPYDGYPWCSKHLDGFRLSGLRDPAGSSYSGVKESATHTNSSRYNTTKAPIHLYRPCYLRVIRYMNKRSRHYYNYFCSEMPLVGSPEYGTLLHAWMFVEIDSRLRGRGGGEEGFSVKYGTMVVDRGQILAAMPFPPFAHALSTVCHSRKLYEDLSQECDSCSCIR